MLDRTRTVTLLLGDHFQYIVNHLTMEFADGFRAAGYPVETVQASEFKSANDLVDFCNRHRVGLFVSHAGQGLDLRPEGNIFNHLGIPVLAMYLDHPLLYWDRADAPIERNLVACLSNDDMAFCERYLSRPKPLMRLPHGGVEKEPSSWEGRDIPVSFCGSLRSTPQEQRDSWRGHGAEVEALLNDMLDVHLADPDQPLTLAVEEGLARVYGRPATALEMFPFYNALDVYFRDKRRVDTILALRDLPMTLAGKGWDKVLPEACAINYLGLIHPDEVREVYSRSRIILNVSNTFHESHERLFDSMSIGAVAFSNRTPLYTESFTDDEVLFFDWNFEGTADAVHALVGDDEAMRARADAGRQAFLAGHTWKHRALAALSRLEESLGV